MNGESLYLEQLQRYIDRLLGNLHQIADLRCELLQQSAKTIHGMRLSADKVNLNFICTHNSRRSHFAQVWCSVALQHFAVGNVLTWSGGTEVTQCNRER